MRKLKYHEKKILKKVDFVNWKNNTKEVALIRKYSINRQEYQSYFNLSLEIKKLANEIIEIKDEVSRVRMTDLLVHKLFNMGLIKTKRIKKCLTIDVKSFCRRRLPILMIQSGMFNGPVSVAVRYVEHGHVRIGPKVIRDPAFFVTSEQEDYITWDDKFNSKIAEYRGEKDDYDDI